MENGDGYSTVEKSIRTLKMKMTKIYTFKTSSSIELLIS